MKFRDKHIFTNCVLSERGGRIYLIVYTGWPNENVASLFRFLVVDFEKKSADARTRQFSFLGRHIFY